MKKLNSTNCMICFVMTRFFLFLNWPVFSQMTNPAFERITTKDGLPQSTVNYIIQDNKGFMWFATYGGICKYDGYSFTVYSHDDNDKTSLSNNGTTFLFEDRDGYIWIVNNANEGLDKFDPVNESFTNYKNDPKDTTSISSNEVYSVVQDRSGNIWICTKNALNLIINEKKGENTSTSFKRFYNTSSTTSFIRAYENKNGKLLLFADYLYYFDNKSYKMQRTTIPLPGTSSTSRIESVCEDKSGNLWIGTNEDGIIKLLYNKYTQNYENTELNEINVAPNNRNYVFIDEKERIWIGTENKGLYLYDTKKDRLLNFFNDKTDATSISDNTIYSLLVDRSGVLWIGTFSQGLCKFNLFQKEFLHYKSIPGNKNSLSGNAINSIHSTVPGQLWIAVDLDGGVNRFTFDHDKVKKVIHYKHDPNKTNTIGGNNILCLVQRKNKEVWAGSAFGTVSKIIPEKQGNIDNPIIKAYNINSWTFCIYEDRQGTLWGGTWSGGLWRYDDKTDKFTFYTNDPSSPLSLCDNVIWAISEDISGNIWIGGHNEGLSILPVKEKKKSNPEFVNFKHEDGNPQSLSNNTVNVFFQDHAGTMWIGTNGGLNKAIIQDNDFRNIHPNTKIDFFTNHINDGLPSENINGILEDDHGNLWLSTTNGLSKFNIEKDTFTNYNENDGLQGTEFSHNSYFKDQNGRMYFGGFNGFNAFYPDSIKPNPFPPQVVFTDFKLFYKSVKIGEKVNEDVILSKSINETSEIVISHRNNVFSIEFAALHYTESGKNKYAYKMEGFNKEWVETNADFRSASYTNLPAGKYIFKVKASNNDGIWNEEGASIKITITPPFWEKLWFRIFFIVFIIGMLGSFYYYRTRSILKRNESLENTVKERTNELANERNLLRSVIDIVPASIYIKNIEKRFLLNNKTHIDSLGAESQEDILGKTDFDFFPEKQTKNSHEDDDRIFKTGQPVLNKEEKGIEPKTQKNVWVMTSKLPLRDHQGKLRGIVGVSWDITERKQWEENLKKANEALEEQRNMLRTLIDNLPDRVFFKDKESRFVINNLAHLRAMGVSAQEEVAGKTDFDIFPRELAEQYFNDEQKVIQSGQPLKEREEPAEDQLTGEKKWLLTFKEPLHDSRGKIVGLVGISRDITEHKKAQETLARQAQALKTANHELRESNRELEQTQQMLTKTNLELQSSNQELEQFAYVASHDLQEPLRMITSYATLIQRKLEKDLDADTKEFFFFMTDGVKRMQILINDLLSYSRVATQAKPFEKINLNDVLDRALGNLKVTISEKGALITHDPLPSVMCDAVQMERLFQNLIGNALKYCEKTPEIHISTEKKKDEWIIGIKDNGIGIDSTYNEKIFGIFQRLHRRDEYSGTGIGLAVCKKTVERHGGRIWVESEGEGKGSTFKFTISG